jgi:transitional endoplasmic reticulum ATPase
MRVVSVDLTYGTVFGKVQSGRMARVTGLTGDLPMAGDLIFVTSDAWVFAPTDAWREHPSIGIIRRRLEDGSLLVDTSFGIVRVSNPDEVEISAGNTIEYNDVEGVIGVLSKDPIRSRDWGQDDEDVASSYLIDDTEGVGGFEAFGGYPHVIARARELIETQLDRRESLNKIGARPVKGILFTGPPGTGKTHLARIIAKESKAKFYLVSGPSIISKWVGDTEDTLRKIFEAASAADRAIVFFDEIDSIAERRTGDSHEMSKRLVAQLLTLLDGFDTRGKNVVVIAATNRIESLDPALTRPGRFDWEIEFGAPTVDDRVKILGVGAAQLKTLGELPIEDVAALTGGWSAAELTAIWAEAALLAVGDGREAISGEDMAQAYERVASRPRHEARSDD